MKDYIVASCKAWHQDGFQSLINEIKENWIWVNTPEELVDAVKSHSPNYIFFLHWNWYVPEDIWREHECVCFHMTDVPFGRGGSPLQNLIVAGHKETKLSALQMVKEMDAGPVYTKRPLSLSGRAADIYMRAGEISFDIIRWMIQNKPKPVPQQGEPVLFKRRKPEQSLLPMGGSLATVYDHIRMLDAPTYPHAFIQHGNFIIEFQNAEMHDNELIASAIIRKIQ